MMRFPRDIDETFRGSWEAYNELPGTKGLDDTVRAEAFRILLQQADVKLRTLKSAKDFITVNNMYKTFIKKVRTSYLLNNFVPVKNLTTLDLNEDRHTNVCHGYTISGTVLLRPQRFAMEHLLNRMYQVQVFKEYPEVLFGRREGDKKVTKRFASSRSLVRDADYFTIHRDSQMVLRVARLKSDYLVLSYALHFDDVLPLYPNLEKQIFAIWRRASLGDIQ